MNRGQLSLLALLVLMMAVESVDARPRITFLAPMGDELQSGAAAFRNQFHSRIRTRHPYAELQMIVMGVEDAKAPYPWRTIALPTVFVTAHTDLAKAASSRFPGASVILATLADPQQLGFDITGPGRPNVSGFTFHHEFELKHFEFLREIDPRIRRVGVIVDRHWQTEALSRRILDQGPALLGMEVEIFSLEEGGDPLEWSKGPSAARMDAWFVPDTPTNRIHGAAIAREVRRLQRPSIGGHRSHAVGGGLMVYEPDRVDPWPRIARIVNLVLSGVPARDIAFDRPSTFRLTVNLKAAAELGVAMPVSLTRRADEVIR